MAGETENMCIVLGSFKEGDQNAILIGSYVSRVIISVNSIDWFVSVMEMLCELSGMNRILKCYLGELHASHLCINAYDCS